MDLNQAIENLHLIGIVRSTKNATTIASPGHSSDKPHRPLSSRIVQNFILIWLHSHIDEASDEVYHNSITELRRVVNTIKTFTDANECIDFLTDIQAEKILMIISDEFGQNVVPLVHDITQLNSIYLLCKNVSQHQQWVKQWSKVKDIFTAISPICQALKQDVHRCDQDLISISFVPTNNGNLHRNLDQLEPTFMYTQILKEIFLNINFTERHIKDFTAYYRENIAVDNIVQLNNIDEFERDYRNRSPIWWYTHEYCLYSFLNGALRTMEVDIIIKMGFLIHDLHREIARLHSEQFSEHHQSETFTIYRGQGLHKTVFDQMLKTQGGLISFNNFLSTSTELSVAVGFAHGSLANPVSVGIVFVMNINPLIKSTPFACINDVSYYKTEEEILFSMHTVFRIGDIVKIDDNNNRLWQVDLIQTNDNDSQLNDLTERVRNEIQGGNEWDRLGKLLIKLSQFDKVDELNEDLLEQTDNDRKKIHFYDQLGWSKKKQKKYEEAITFYEKSLAIKQEILPPNDPSLAISCNDIGSVYAEMNQYSKALLYYEKGLDIQLKTQSSDDSRLAHSYSNIGSVYKKMGEYSQALSHHEKAIEIQQKLLPSNQLLLSYSHNNIGSVYEKMSDYSKALSSHQKALEIQEEILPSYHPDLAQSHSYIGFVYYKMRQYSKACDYHQRAVDIGQRSSPFDHPRLQQWQKNLEFAKNKM